MKWTRINTTAGVSAILFVTALSTIIAVIKFHAHRERNQATSSSVWQPTSADTVGVIRPPTRVWSVPGDHSSNAGLVQMLALDSSKSNHIILKSDVTEAQLQQGLALSKLAAKSPGGRLPVLILTLTDVNASGLKTNSSSAPGSCDLQGGHCVGINQPLSCLIPFLAEYCGGNITDGTENGHFDFDLHWSGPHDPQHRNVEGLKEVLREQLGLELLPGKMTSQILISNPPR